MKTFFQLREETTGQVITVPKAIFEAALQMLNEEDSSVTSKVKKLDPEAIHISSHGTQHLYSGAQADHDNHTYHVHDTSTGKTHHVSLDHGGEEMSHSEIKNETPSHVSPAVVKAIHKDHKGEAKFF